MKIILAFDSFKGAVSARQACEAAAEGVLRAHPQAETILCPLSDGGEGFADCMRIAGEGRAQAVTVTGPLFEKVSANIVWLDGGKTAVLEGAEANGLYLVPADKRSPLNTTTFGLGEMMRAAVEGGARKLVIGIGGSATNDAGIGMLSALGWQFFDEEGNTVTPIGASLAKVRSITPGMLFPDIEVIAACDVNNPLFGPQGAAYVFGPQKGASREDVLVLDNGLRRFAKICAETFGKNLDGNPGAGAAGGLGYALQMFLNARFQPGAAIAIDHSHLIEKLIGADICFTGEGRTDFQTASGKLPAAVNEVCRRANVPCVCLSGGLGEDWRSLYKSGFIAIFSISQGPATLKEAISNAEIYLADAAEAVTRLYGRR